MPSSTPNPPAPWIVRCRDDSHAAGEAARSVLDAFVCRRDSCFALALSGGRSAARFFAELLRQAALRRAALSEVHYFWADERCVPPDHAESNFRLAHEALLKPLGVPPTRLHRLAGERPPADAERHANSDWERWTASRSPTSPGLDVAVLGVGEDGHVASLFPENLPADLTSTAPFRAVTGPKPPPLRITMGYSLLAQARRVVVLATGAGKETVVRRSLDGTLDTPLGRLLACRSVGDTVLILGASDRIAA